MKKKKKNVKRQTEGYFGHFTNLQTRRSCFTKWFTETDSALPAELLKLKPIKTYSHDVSSRTMQEAGCCLECNICSM